jgi:hypothetical protein
LATARATSAIAIETQDSGFRLSTFGNIIPEATASFDGCFTISMTFGSTLLLTKIGGASRLAKLAELNDVGSGSTIRTIGDSTAEVGPGFWRVSKTLAARSITFNEPAEQPLLSTR